MFSFAFRNLLTRPVRSLLSLLGLTVAIAGMVGLFSVARGLDAAVSDAFGDMDGLNVLQPGAPIPLFSSLPAEWEAEIAAVPGVAAVSAEVWQRVNVLNNKLIISPPRFLCGVDLATRGNLEYDVYAESIVDGRFLNIDDAGTSNAVVSQSIVDEFDIRIGDTITVNAADATVVGIYETGSILLDVGIFLDAGFVRDITRFDPTSVSDFYVEAAPGVDPDELATTIEQQFAGRDANPWRPPSLGSGTGSELSFEDLFDAIDRALKEGGAGQASGGRQPSEEETNPVSPLPADAGGSPTMPEAGDLADAAESAVEVRTASDWAAQVDNLSADLDLILTILTSIGVLIALLSIINTMLMSVSERIIEFGILKANGWSKANVLQLVTFESGLLGLGGGVFGSAIGWAGTLILNSAFPDRLNLYASPGLIAFAVAFSTILGVAAGLYPAFWAMRMMPMDAIRRG